MNQDSINIIFHFSEAELGKGNYKVVYAYGSDGLISFFAENQNKFFETKEAMIERVQDYLDTQSFEDANLLAINDLNIGIESCNDFESFNSLFKDYGSVVMPRDASGQGKGFLSKLF